MSYHIGSQGIVAIPIYIRHTLALKETTTGSGRLDITVGPKQTLGRTVNTLIIVKILIVFMFNKYF
jgi:AP-3 complex subunit mu